MNRKKIAHVLNTKNDYISPKDMKLFFRFLKEENLFSLYAYNIKHTTLTNYIAFDHREILICSFKFEYTLNGAYYWNNVNRRWVNFYNISRNINIVYE